VYIFRLKKKELNIRSYKIFFFFFFIIYCMLLYFLLNNIFNNRSIRSDTDSVDNTNTETITRYNGRDVIIDEWEKLETIASN